MGKEHCGKETDTGYGKREDKRECTLTLDCRKTHESGDKGDVHGVCYVLILWEVAACLTSSLQMKSANITLMCWLENIMKVVWVRTYPEINYTSNSTNSPFSYITELIEPINSG